MTVGLYNNISEKVRMTAISGPTHGIVERDFDEITKPHWKMNNPRTEIARSP